MTEDERIQILTDLGLTLLQAKIYLALSKTNKATIKTISKTANIARQDIYRIMPALQKLGLAQKVLTAPTMYKATPTKEGYCLLLQRKAQQHTELQTKTIALIRDLHGSNDENTPQEEESQFVITTSTALLAKMFAEKRRTVKASMDGILSWEGTKAAFTACFQDFRRAMKRGIRFRAITEEHEDDISVQRILQTLKENPLFEIRYLPAPIPVNLCIYDGTDASIEIAMTPLGFSDNLLSNNPHFVKIMVTYFESLWNKAMDAPEILPRKNVKLKQPQTRRA